jgi:hypothetical protein
LISLVKGLPILSIFSNHILSASLMVLYSSFSLHFFCPFLSYPLLFLSVYSFESSLVLIFVVA